MRNLIYHLVQYTGLNWIISLFLRKKIYVIMYHSISDAIHHPKNNLHGHLSLDIEVFKKQIKYLQKRGHTFIRLTDIGKIDFNQVVRPTVIYFDDGFKDVYTNALPFLKKESIPATIFLVSGILDKTDMLWTLQYREVAEKRGISITAQNEFIEKVKFSTDAYRQEVMKEFPLEDASKLFDLFMNWGEIREIVKWGFDIGSHSVSHLRLDEASLEKRTQEVIFSRRRLMEELKLPITSFSFPYARGSKAVMHTLKHAGYTHVVTAGKGLNDETHLVDQDTGLIYLKNISPKINESLVLFKIRMYFLNLR